MRIYIVDDDKIIRQGVRTIIENSSLDCTIVGEASDGELALKDLEQYGKVDLLITDIRMPIMDGMELIKQVKERFLASKFIVLSGYDEFKFVRNAFVYGIMDYLLKPINKKEFLELLNKIQESIQEDNEREGQIRESNQILIGSYLNQLFHTPYSECYDKVTALADLGLNLEDKNYFIAISRIDNYYRRNMERMEYEGALERIFNHTEEEYKKKLSKYNIIQYINGIEVISIVYSEDTFKANEIAQKMYECICDTKMEDTTYTLGYGNVYKGFKNIAKAYEEALKAIEARFYLGRNHIIDFNCISNKLIEINYDLDPVVDKLIYYIELYDYMNCKKIIDSIFLDLSYIEAPLFRKYIKNLIERVNLQVKDFQEAIISSAKEYIFYLENINTYNDLKSYLCTLIKSSLEYMKSERDKRSKMRIELAKKYIAEHYAENITLNEVAEVIDLNASYFSNLFKIEMGINFSDYLLEVRMKMARKLLRDPILKVYEIGAMVGYEDAVSFGRAFKKKVGMSPKDYRNTVY